MGGLSQCDISTHINFGQLMAVIFRPVLILISVGFFAFKEITMRFLAFEGTAAQGFPTLVGLLHEMYSSSRDCSMRLECTVTNVPPDRTQPMHGSVGLVP